MMKIQWETCVSLEQYLEPGEVPGSLSKGDKLKRQQTQKATDSSVWSPQTSCFSKVPQEIKMASRCAWEGLGWVFRKNSS